ncbi:Septum site-determining protein MinD [Listeria monocytogenes N53-1]|nr:Septum site-determining protein MinD [Listeria monocytogenes N53-1]
MMMNGDVMDIDEITYRLNYLVLSLMMMKLFALQIAMLPNNRASQGYRNIARRILGESIPLMSIETKKAGFFARLKQLFSGK